MTSKNRQAKSKLQCFLYRDLAGTENRIAAFFDGKVYPQTTRSMFD